MGLQDQKAPKVRRALLGSLENPGIWVRLASQGRRDQPVREVPRAPRAERVPRERRERQDRRAHPAPPDLQGHLAPLVKTGLRGRLATAALLVRPGPQGRRALTERRVNKDRRAQWARQALLAL